jgi:hypothetical protein
MPRVCPLCTHRDAGPLLQDLMLGKSYRELSARYHVRIAAISAHVRRHLAGPFKRLIESEHALATDAIIIEPVRQQLQKLNLRLERILSMAESKQELMVALHATEQIRKTLEVVGRITGEVPIGPAAAVADGSQPLIVQVNYVSTTKPIVDASKPVLEAAAALPEPADPG